MTEDDAKKKICCGPPAVALILHTKSEPKIESTYRALLCQGSACMAWRWAGYRAKNGTWVRKTADGPWDPVNADGFCGLAGTPQ